MLLFLVACCSQKELHGFAGLHTAAGEQFHSSVGYAKRSVRLFSDEELSTKASTSGVCFATDGVVFNLTAAAQWRFLSSCYHPPVRIGERSFVAQCMQAMCLMRIIAGATCV